MKISLRNKMEDLNKRLEHLQEMVEIPQLFVADFFFGLRNEIDKVYLKKETDGTPSVKDEWMKIISRIEAFEKELSNSIKKQLNVAFTEEANKRILEIKTKLDDFKNEQIVTESQVTVAEILKEEAVIHTTEIDDDEYDDDEYDDDEYDDDENENEDSHYIEKNPKVELNNDQEQIQALEKLIRTEEYTIKKALFLNKTITVYNQEKLVIIHSYFFTDQDLKDIKNKLETFFFILFHSNSVKPIH